MSLNQKQSTPKRVWYTSYGSNLKRKRFMCYIKDAKGTQLLRRKFVSVAPAILASL